MEDVFKRIWEHIEEDLNKEQEVKETADYGKEESSGAYLIKEKVLLFMLTSVERECNL